MQPYLASCVCARYILPGNYQAAVSQQDDACQSCKQCWGYSPLERVFRPATLQTKAAACWKVRAAYSGCLFAPRHMAQSPGEQSKEQWGPV